MRALYAPLLVVETQPTIKSALDEQLGDLKILHSENTELSNQVKGALARSAQRVAYLEGALEGSTQRVLQLQSALAKSADRALQLEGALEFRRWWSTKQEDELAKADTRVAALKLELAKADTRVATLEGELAWSAQRVASLEGDILLQSLDGAEAPKLIEAVAKSPTAEMQQVSA